MIKVLILFAGLLTFIELYSLGVFFLAKRNGDEKPWKNFIPYYAFRTARRLSGRFTVLTIPVTKMAGTLVFTSVVATLATLWGIWGDCNLPALSSESLWQIMALVIGLCIGVSYYTVVAASAKLYRRFRIQRERLFTVLSLLVLSLPVLYCIASRNEPRSDGEMY